MTDDGYSVKVVQTVQIVHAVERGKGIAMHHNMVKSALVALGDFYG